MRSDNIGRREWFLASLLGLAGLLSAGPAPARAADRYERARQELVELVAEGVQDPRVLKAIGETPRHLFVPPQQRPKAYLDLALAIGDGATISPPYVVAFMTEQLDPQPTDKVLEIGTGSGYQAAILSPLVSEVYSIEILPGIGRSAEKRLQEMGYENVHVRIGDGFAGWPEAAPFDKIIVTCSPEKIPRPLVEQLKDGGRMVIPLGERFRQALCLVSKKEGRLTRTTLESTFFIPMTGQAEALRRKQADDGVPELVNGGFESLAANGTPLGFYYLRQAEIVSDSAPRSRGGRALKLTNEDRSRTAQALQAIGVDGERFEWLNLEALVRYRGITPTLDTHAFAGFDIRFYNKRRAQCGIDRIGPWLGTSGWRRVRGRIRVPPSAELAVISMGLFGFTGELLLDDLQLEGIARRDRND